jgi:hypothetical protein
MSKDFAAWMVATLKIRSYRKPPPRDQARWQPLKKSRRKEDYREICSGKMRTCSDQLERTGKDALMTRESNSSKRANSLFSILPQELQFEVISFLYDDTELIGALLSFEEGLSSQMYHPDLKRHMSLCILNSSSNQQFFCRICCLPICYPYQLTDPSCGHYVCGRCAWIRRQELSSCGCGVKIRSRPKRLDPKPADCRAYWILDDEGKHIFLGLSTMSESRSNLLMPPEQDKGKRLQTNERRVHKGIDGVFGENGAPNSIDPFERVSFEADYDYLPTLNIRSTCHIDHHLPSNCGRLFIILCPAHENYKPYIIEEFDANVLGRVWSMLFDRRWVRSICNEDIVTLEEEALDEKIVSEHVDDVSLSGRKRFEVRLVGWEILAGDSADYDF